MEAIKNIVNLLPSFSRCDSLIIGSKTVLVTVGGFEDRTLAAAKIADNKKGRVIVLNYKPNNKLNKLSEVISTFTNKGFTINEEDIIEFNRFNPEVFSIVFQKRVTELNIQKVILDISAMSKLALLLCLKACWDLNIDTSVFYAEAEHKGPIEKEFERAKISGNLHQPSTQIYTGIHGVIRVTGLSSVAMQGQPSAAIVFMSFNELLTQALLDSVYPSRLFLINSRSPKWKWREEATAWIHEQLRGEWQNSDNPLTEQNENGTCLPKRVVSSFDYKETICVLLDLYWELSTDHRILLAPTGSKIQTLGCFFAKALHPDIHIEYPTPEGFFDTYSKGIGGKWIVEFGSIKDKIDELHRIERKHLLGIHLNTSPE